MQLSEGEGSSEREILATNLPVPRDDLVPMSPILDRECGWLAGRQQLRQGRDLAGQEEPHPREALGAFRVLPTPPS